MGSPNQNPSAAGEAARFRGILSAHAVARGTDVRVGAARTGRPPAPTVRRVWDLVLLVWMLPRCELLCFNSTVDIVCNVQTLSPSTW